MFLNASSGTNLKNQQIINNYYRAVDIELIKFAPAWAGRERAALKVTRIRLIVKMLHRNLVFCFCVYSNVRLVKSQQTVWNTPRHKRTSETIDHLFDETLEKNSLILSCSLLLSVICTFEEAGLDVICSLECSQQKPFRGLLGPTCIP